MLIPMIDDVGEHKAARDGDLPIVPLPRQWLLESTSAHRVHIGQQAAVLIGPERPETLEIGGRPSFRIGTIVVVSDAELSPAKAVERRDERLCCQLCSSKESRQERAVVVSRLAVVPHSSRFGCR
jgi:hypothetical protein